MFLDYLLRFFYATFARALGPLLVLQFDTEWLYGCVVSTFFFAEFLQTGFFYVLFTVGSIRSIGV